MLIREKLGCDRGIEANRTCGDRSLDWRLEVEAGSRMRRGGGGEGAASAAAACYTLQLETLHAGRVETLHLQVGGLCRHRGPRLGEARVSPRLRSLAVPHLR